jgi:hypothetical protein
MSRTLLVSGPNPGRGEGGLFAQARQAPRKRTLHLASQRDLERLFSESRPIEMLTP